MAPLFGQNLENPCQETDYPFTGTPEATLCSQYGNTLCVAIGANTGAPKASDLTSNVIQGSICVQGNFIVDVPFTFKNCFVQVSPGAAIIVDMPVYPAPTNSLTLDNAKLFACHQLWKGIEMKVNTWIVSKNSTIIEDAEIAIKANEIFFNRFDITNTTFNRDRVGMSIEGYAKNFTSFRNNKFTCTAPLNGTDDEITDIGMRIGEATLLNLGNTTNSNNIFRKIVNGIVVDGVQTDLSITDFRFLDIKDTGINFKGRSLKAKNSTFKNVLRNGIFFIESSRLELLDVDFYAIDFDPGELENEVRMLTVAHPKPGNYINIGNDCSF